jgi:hypothetical protein
LIALHFCFPFFATDIDRVKYEDIQFICRKLLVADYIQKCESEIERIKSNTEHLTEQETCWQKLESYIKRSLQLQLNYLSEMSKW